jgi:O-antigen/teichoic acid export membrane protein
VLPRELKHMTGGKFDKTLAATYASYGMPVAMSLILALVLSSTDRLLLGAFLDEAAVGVYHAGYSLGSRTLDVVFIWLGMAGAPALIAALERGGQPAVNEAAREQAGFMVLLTLPAAVGLALVARPLPT